MKERGAARFPAATVYKTNELTKGARTMEMVGYIYNADNMTNTFKAGDKLYVIPQDFAADGQLAVIQNGDAVEVKYYYNADGGVILRDENPKYAPQRLDNPPQILGVVVGFERMF